MGVAVTALHAQTIPLVSMPACGACAAPAHGCTHPAGPAGPADPADPADAPAPRLSGDASRIEPLLARLAPQMQQVFGHPVDAGVWLASLRVSPGQAHLALAPGLACRAGVVAELAFEAMRELLPDTDLYIDPPQD